MLWHGANYLRTALVATMNARDDNATRSRDNTPDETHEHSSAPPREPNSGTTELSGGEPEHFGRYKVLRTLGSGGFGVVYLGFDNILERVVAIKVPRGERIRHPEQIEAYLAEARLVANLEHPAIVRVYDCGQEGDQRCFVVSQYIDGGDLADWLKTNRAEHGWCAELIVRMAEALHHAHKARIVHRDVKPSNILLDGAGTAFLADFGLAMREQDFGRGSGYAGTPRYMSPEQARGEGHRVDGRSDVYSLGVVLYELLAGRVPFVAESITDLLEQIQVREPPPLRLSTDSIPAELDRIVTKCLAKRAADRYPTAADLADDLRAWLTETRRTPAAVIAAPSSNQTPGSNVSPNQGETRPPRVVPKGLRAFDANDADFFLRLLPGPRDRDGLPESLRFWKTKLEQRDGNFSVGLLYGPSGCGKSSFVRAGLLPRISSSIAAIVIDATPHDTEPKLLAALRKHRTDLAKVPTLSEALAHLRRTPQGPILIVIDQFEQWLAAHPDLERSELARDLRQCDGQAIQALLLVRDDFWMAATRFFRELEIPLQEGANSAAVDLFDADHARKVLAGFGRAFGKLPAKRTDYSPAQNQFLDRAVAGLASTEGRIVCVRLALFAEMVKAKPWEPATLDAVGGLDGIGVAFLEDAFGDTAAPSHKLYQAAARSVLAALLPSTGVDIKKTQAPREALLTASGYAVKPREFDELLTILDSELRLVTPVETDHGTAYQLTHDFMVPPLRDWLTRKQKETRRGRAELLLAERASLWSAKPSSRFLPSLIEWGSINAFTRRKTWNNHERRMMRKASLRFAGMGMLSLLVLAGLALLGVRFEAQARAESLVREAASAQPTNLPDIVARMEPVRSRVNPLLADVISNPPNDQAQQSLTIASKAEEPEELLAYLRTLEAANPRRTSGFVVLLSSKKTDSAFAAKTLETDPGFLMQIPNDSFVPFLRRFQNDSNLKASLRKLLITPKRNATIINGSSVNGESDAEYEARITKALSALYVLGETESLWAKLSIPGTLRTQLIHEFVDIRVDPGLLIQRYPNESNAIIKASLLMMLTGLEASVTNEGKATLTPHLLSDYQNHPDANVHAMTNLLLRRWKKTDEVARIDAEMRDTISSLRGWQVNQLRQTFTLFRKPPYSFFMGANRGESDRKADSNRHTREIPRAFEIGSREITVREMIELVPSYRDVWKKNPRQSPTEDCPAVAVTWIDAAKYCNLLSQRDGIPEDQWCYKISVDEQNNTTIEVKPNILELTGYRLPTEAEWEFAARGGSSTSRHFGSDDRLLSRYAWFNRNSDDRAHPVAQLLPNDYGLFDTLGNASEWTLTAFFKDYRDYPEDGRVVDRWPEDDQLVGFDRSFRGGAYFDPALDVRSSRRYALKPTERALSLGFRVARTLPIPKE